MGGAIDPNAIPLPSGWSVFAKDYLLRAVGLARYALTHVRSWCADSPIARVRLKGRVEPLEAEIALLKEELRIKDTRLAAIPARQRPHYLPQDRLAILVLKTALSLKTVLLRKILVPFDMGELRRSIAKYFDWHNGLRPHRSIGGAAPLELYRGAQRANESRRVEPRSSYPANGICAKPQSAARAGKRPRNLELVVSGLHGAPASLLPIITLRDAA